MWNHWTLLDCRIPWGLEINEKIFHIGFVANELRLQTDFLCNPLA